MVEVFKTTIKTKYQAYLVLDKIDQNFSNYKANFDLEDCDKILRVCSSDFIQSSLIIKLIGKLGFHAEVLSDEILINKC